MPINLGSRNRNLKQTPADPFTDLLFNTLIGFMLLFFIAIVFLNPEKKSGKIDIDAEYVISITWPDNNPDDIDTWVEDPNGNITWFRDRDAGLVHLDRDDRGMFKDVLMINGEEVANPLNQEITTIRGMVPGEYTVNLHYYASQTKKPVIVKVKVAKVNPVYEVVYYADVEMKEKGQERTAVRFSIQKDGTIDKINQLQKKLVITN